MPFRAYDGKEILPGGTDIPQKKFGKSRISEGEIPKLLRQDLVANSIFFASMNKVFRSALERHRIRIVRRPEIES